MRFIEKFSAKDGLLVFRTISIEEAMLKIGFHHHFIDGNRIYPFLKTKGNFPFWKVERICASKGMILPHTHGVEPLSQKLSKPTPIGIRIFPGVLGKKSQ